MIISRNMPKTTKTKNDKEVAVCLKYKREYHACGSTGKLKKCYIKGNKFIKILLKIIKIKGETSWQTRTYSQQAK